MTKVVLNVCIVSKLAKIYPVTGLTGTLGYVQCVHM